ncbi:MAG: hypothetical protein KBC43_08040 [Bacteroidales bacterium]|nr:hypothetical protein [Bacteroidales bacterium]
MEDINMSDSAYFPYDMIFDDNYPVKKKLQDQFEALLIEHNVMGNLRWGDLRKFDKKLAAKLTDHFIQSERKAARYKLTGAYIPHSEIKAKLKQGIDVKIPDIPSSVESKKKLSSNETIEMNTGKKKKSMDVKDLLKLPVNTLTLRQIKVIQDKGNLDIKKFAPYFNRHKELKSKKINYNKPPHIKTAVALITKVFSGRANPSMWIDYPEIIKAKLYSIKMGIQYLERENPEALMTVLSKFQPKIDELLKRVHYNNFDEINF